MLAGACKENLVGKGPIGYESVDTRTLPFEKAEAMVAGLEKEIDTAISYCVRCVQDLSVSEFDQTLLPEHYVQVRNADPQIEVLVSRGKGRAGA